MKPLKLELPIIPLLLLIIACSKKDPVEPPPVSEPEPEFEATDFTAAEQCASCHPNHYNEWRSSMHAYSFVDPVFFAMHERGQSETGGALDQFCTKCHSPIASRSGETPPFFDRNALSPISHQGVSCDVCHTTTGVNKISNADFDMSPGNVKFGPLADPVPNSFHQSQFNTLFDRSEFCGSCHEVVNPENVLVEETYSEWVRASVAGMSADCQDCHMPLYAGEAAVGGPQRDRLHRHYFVGVDVPLVDFPGADLQRQMTEDLLKSAAALNVSHPPATRPGDTLALQVRIENLRAGHGLPSGVTAERQMWIAVVARDAGGRVLYQSGQIDANGDLMDQHSVLNPNADPDLVIFRQTLRDENGKEVLFFWQAKKVENNQIPLFSSQQAIYRIPVPREVTGPVSLEAKLRFRSLPPYFLRELKLGDLAAKIPTIDMAQAQGTIAVDP
ncbi:MAG: multiheme c-type cytochrome [bacterium]